MRRNLSRRLTQFDNRKASLLLADRACEPVLQAVAIVGIERHRSVLQQLTNQIGTSDVSRQKTFQIGGTPRGLHRLAIERPGESFAQRDDIMFDRFHRASQQQILRVRLPDFDVRKDRGERGEDGVNAQCVDLISLQPLHEDAPVGESLLRGLIELLSEQSRDPSSVRIGRLRNDQVITFVRGEQDFARIVEDDVDIGVVQHVAVHRGTAAGHFDDGRFEFHDIDPLHRLDRAEPARRFTRSQSDDQRTRGVAVQDGSHLTEHHLRSHVDQRAAVAFAVHIERQAVRHFQRDARFDPFRLPPDAATLLVNPAPNGVRRFVREPGATDADAAVTPDRSRAIGLQTEKRQRDRRHGQDQRPDGPPF